MDNENKQVPTGIPKICATCRYKDTPCDWCFYDKDGTDNWEWDGREWPHRTDE